MILKCVKCSVGRRYSRYVLNMRMAFYERRGRFVEKGKENKKDFYKSKIMELPRDIVVGHNVIFEVGKVCKRLNLRGKGLIVSDNNTKKIAGDTVEEILNDFKFDVDQIITEDATTQAIEEVKAYIKENKSKFVLGVGGGRPIDVAKCSSHESHIPFLSIPTAASHDGIVSSQASIKTNKGRVSIAVQTPLAVIADTKIIASAPHKLLAAGCGDIISNSTAVMDWILARNLRNEYYSSYAAALSEMIAKLLIENADSIKPNLEESAWLVAKALVSSGVAMSIAGSSRPASGSEHKFSHALDRIAVKPALHGEQCGVGTIMMTYLHGKDWLSIKEALTKIGAPTTAKELGVKDDEIIKALTQAHNIKPERYTILGNAGLAYKAAERLATITMVIGG